MKWLKVIIIIIILNLLIGCVRSKPKDITPQDVDFRLNPGVDTITVDTPFVDAGATAYIEGIEFEVHVIENTVNTSRVGVYKIVYEVRHERITASIQRIVHVISQALPTIQLISGIDTIQLNETWIDAGAIAIDSEDNKIEYITIGNVNTAQLGIYEITYIAEDTHGNRVGVTRYVHVIE